MHTTSVRSHLHTGKPVDLPPDAEELAGWFGALLETEHAADEVFQKNFFSDWQAVLKNHPPVSACFFISSVSRTPHRTVIVVNFNLHMLFPAAQWRGHQGL
jgi:hypothetical protein